MQDPPDADDPLALAPDQAYFSQFPWEHADIINGNLLFSFTDLALPGDAGMDLRLVRSYNHQDEEQKWTFGIAGVPIFIDTETQPATFDPILVSADGGRQVARPAGGSTFLTQDFSRYDTATRTLEMPNGWVATYHTGSPYDRMLAQVTDPFGNTITPTWEPDGFRPQRLNQVVQTVSGATRRVEFSYTEQSGRMPSRMRLIDGNGPGAHRDWYYDYGPSQPDTLVKMLSQVTPPAGAPWTFAYEFGSGSPPTDSVLVTTPNGGTVSYELPRSFHGTAEFGYRARIASRTTGGRAIPAGTWVFQWGKNPGRVTLPDGRELTFVHEFAGGGFGRRWILRARRSAVPAQLPPSRGSTKSFLFQPRRPAQSRSSPRTRLTRMAGPT